MMCTLMLWGARENSADNMLKFCSYFIEKNVPVSDISCKLSYGESLHELSSPIFLGKSEKHHRLVVGGICPESAKG